MIPMNSGPLPQWIREALQALRPPGRMTVSEWADKNRILSDKTSALPGPWRTAYTPYLQGIMDSFTDPEVEEIVFVKCSQVGGTEAILNMLGYAISQDPSPTMVVYPSDTLGEWTADNRIQPMVDLSPELAAAQLPGGKKLDMQFMGMYLAIASAQSPSSLASRPCRYLFLDEVDKYPTSSGKEANPRSLAKERTKTFDNNKKVIEVSTPTLESGPIWQDFQAADSQYQCFVRCPHCGEKWSFELKNLKFDKSTPEVARKTAVYVCPECGCTINDAQRSEMVRQCQWRAVKEGGRRQSQYQQNEVPPGALMLTGGVDVQRKGMYWIVKAWMPNMTNYTIANGYAYSWQEVEYAMNQTYLDRGGKPYIVNLGAVDSGDQTDDVYDFCLRNREWAVATKGSSTRLQSRYHLTTVNKDGLAKGMPLCVVSTEYYKDVLFSRLFRDADHGGWYIYQGVDPEYLEQMTAEHKVVERVRGRMVAHWVLKSSHGDNHYWDCEIYAACAADLCGLRTMAAENQREGAPGAPSSPSPTAKASPAKTGYFN